MLRLGSPVIGSTLMTSAPRSASTADEIGPGDEGAEIDDLDAA